MTYDASPLAVAVFLGFVGVTLGLSFWLGRSAKSSAGFFAAHGQIPWFVNGVAFAGDYLSAASFLGICGMIAFYGYDGFLYSIGFLAGWIVALFVVAEPMKRLGKFTFADALDARFDSPAIKLSAGVATLAVSVFYLIPQMVGAGVLVQPLLGLDHAVGVILVGGTVIAIVVTAGMVSTTWVQFLKGSLLVVFSGVLVAMLWAKGFEVGLPAGESLGPFDAAELAAMRPERDADADGPVGPIDASWQNRLIEVTDPETGRPARYVAEVVEADRVLLHETVEVVRPDDGPITVNGREVAAGDVLGQLRPAGHLTKLPDGETKSGPLGPVDFLATLGKSEVALPATAREFSDGSQTTIYYAKRVPGARVLRPGEHPRFRGIRGGNTSDKLNFLSLMLALFCGTASLPHILIRYYTVNDEAAARKSTVVGIATIGAFYILTLYIGIGAMTSGALDPSNSNMAAPLLARSLADWLFAVISAIAFTTVLGTVSGLILASAGAVTHDLIGTLMPGRLDEAAQVRVAKVASVVIGVAAIALGIAFQDLNVSYLVGWAFSVAASANLPALVMLLFWPRTTKAGIVAAVTVGMFSSLAWILLSGDTFEKVYGWPAAESPVPFSQPGLVTIPLGFLTLVVVSLLTRPIRTEAVR